jgi:hypothetical protein
MSTTPWGCCKVGEKPGLLVELLQFTTPGSVWLGRLPPTSGQQTRFLALSRDNAIALNDRRFSVSASWGATLIVALRPQLESALHRGGSGHL